MTDWSEIFEKRLQTVLQDDANENGRAAALDLTPPSTTHRDVQQQQLQQQQRDPTSAFFESMRRQGGSQTRRYDNGGPVMTPVAQTTTAASAAFDADTEQSIKRLQKSYSNRAGDLHEEAMTQLDGVQETLEAELADMAQQAERFLAAAAEKQAQYSRPAEDWVVKIQTREGASAAKPTATITQKDERVVDRVAAMREAADTLRGDLGRLWEQWHEAQAEASTVLQAMTGSGGSGGRGGSGSSKPTASAGGAGADEVDEIMAKAEKELDAAAAEAMREMKENEKTFKKLIYAEECKIAQTMLSRQSKYD